MTTSPTSTGFLAARTAVRWGDCDPAGIAFYPRFFEWMDFAAHALMREMGIRREEMLLPNIRGLPLVGASAEFVHPARLEDTLEVRVRVTRVGRSSLDLRYEILRVDEGEAFTLVARGVEKRVYIGGDDEGRLRSRELTPPMREALARYGESQ